MTWGDRTKKILVGAVALIILVVLLVVLLPRMGGGGTGDDDVVQGIEAIQEHLASEEPTSITVIGDDSSAGNETWVRDWAENHLGESHAVTYRNYNRGTGAYSKPRTLTTEGPAVEVRNGSFRGANTENVQESLDTLYAEPSDIVVLNLGHHEKPDEMTQQVTDLWNALSAESPTLGLVVIQNPETATQQLQEMRMAALAATAEELDLPTVDVFAAFMEAEQPLPRLVLGSVPTEAGHTLWAQTMDTALDPEAEED